MRCPSPIHREFLSSARACRTDPSLRPLSLLRGFAGRRGAAVNDRAQFVFRYPSQSCCLLASAVTSAHKPLLTWGRGLIRANERFPTQFYGLPMLC